MKHFSRSYRRFGFVVLVGTLILAGAVNTAIIGSLGVFEPGNIGQTDVVALLLG